MRTIFVALALAASLTGADAAEKPWCAQLFGGSGGDPGRICAYVSWEQCRATTGVQDGFCLPNPGYLAGRIAAPARHKKHS